MKVALGLILGLAAIVGLLNLWAGWLPDPLVPRSPVQPGNEKRDILFVLVHGLEGSPASWDGARPALHAHGDVLAVRYPAFPLSNADADAVARGVSKAVQAACEERTYEKVVLIGHSMGALIARKAFLYASGGTEPNDGEDRPSPAPWAGKVTRIVLLAGTNR